jgi:hypothetical protein
MNAGSRGRQGKEIEMRIKETTKVRNNRKGKNKRSFPCASLTATGGWGGGGVECI